MSEPIQDPAVGASPSFEGGAVGRVPYRWVAMGVVLFGTFVVVLDTTVVNLALPALQRDFDTIDGVEWVVTAYLATVGVAQMTSGWVADRFGRKQSFIASLATFTVGSTLCALAPSLVTLVGARVLQGVGGGLMLPIGMAMIYELFDPAERGRALGYFGIALMAAPAIGPVLGGALVDSVGWRWLFLINVPIGLVGIPVAVRLLRDTGFREARPFDRLGLVLSASGLTALLVGLSLGGIDGWSQTHVVVLLAGGTIVMVGFVRHALRTTHPLIDVRILANPIFAIAMATMALMAVAQFSRLVYVPLELGAARGISELRIGFAMLPSALGIALTMPLGGRLADRVGARIPATIGLVVLAASFWPLAHLGPETPLPMISAVLFVGGLGAGLSMMAPNIVAMNSVTSTKVSQASALSSVTRQVSAAFGIAILAAFFATIRPVGDPATIPTSDVVDAFNQVFVVALVVLVVAVVVAQWLPGRATAKALQDERRRETQGMGLELTAPIEA